MLSERGPLATATRRMLIVAVSAVLLASSVFVVKPWDTSQAREVMDGRSLVSDLAPEKLDPPPSTNLVSSEQGSALQPAPAPHNPRLDPLPKWVQSTQETALWSSSRSDAAQLSILPKNRYLQVLGQPENGRLPVYLDGGDGGRPFGAWVNPASVLASDPPARVAPSSRGGSRSSNPDISSPEKFIGIVAEAAQESQRLTGVPSSVTIAQAILESEWGKSLLATKGFNFFGIKAAKAVGPAGVISMNTWEVLSGVDTTVNAAFKAYHNIFESVDDHGHFLRDNARYAAAFKVIDDPQEFARRINSAGYATDPAYSAKLIRLMDKYNLCQYDLRIP